MGCMRRGNHSGWQVFERERERTRDWQVRYADNVL
jgi:hypothetical protein